MPVTITKRVEWDAAHRLQRHPGKCSSIHGHRYAAEITVLSQYEVDDSGMVLDFGSLKHSISEWIDSNWDHALILEDTDPLVGVLSNPDKKLRSFLLGSSPTAEAMAEYLYHVSSVLVSGFRTGLSVSKVRVFETPGSWADFTPSHR